MGKKVLIVGGVAGGATAAARLRRLDETAEIILFERGEYISYANCGLPYHVGDVIRSRNALLLMQPNAMMKKFNMEVRTRQEVVSIDREHKRVAVNNLATGETYFESYDNLILSTGSSPVRPPIPGIDSPRVMTLWTVPDTDRIRKFLTEHEVKSAVVVGAGFIGLEMAENLHATGAHVTVVELLDQVMPPLDLEMAKLLEAHLKERGVSLCLGCGVAGFEETQSGVTVRLNGGGSIAADLVILAIGVRPNGGLAKAAGLDVNARGGVVVDEYLRTSDPSIYAVGDVTETADYIDGSRAMIPLAGPANKQGRIAANNIAGENERYEGTQGTSVVKVFELTAAATGASEKLLNKRGMVKGKDYESVIIMQNSHAGYYPGASLMTLKLLFSMDGKKLFGAQIVGREGVDKRIDVISTVIRLHGGVQELKSLELAYAPPYGSAKDAVNMLGFVADNVLSDKVAFSSWDALDHEDPNRVVIDVRDDAERLMYTVPEAYPLPLSEVRARMHELDKTKEIVVFCAIGVRAYNAARILQQNGFQNVKVYPGGTGFYRATHPGAAEDESRWPEDGITQGATDAPAAPERSIVTSMRVDCSGMQCPGPILKVFETMQELREGEIIEVYASDHGFLRDVGAWCKRTGNTYVKGGQKGSDYVAYIQKGGQKGMEQRAAELPQGKTLIVFSGDLDRALASFIVANGAAAMGRPVTMFFTFWGLNILRKPQKQKVKKSIIERMFGGMMPRGAGRLKLSKLNMAGMGTAMMKAVMKDKNVDSLEELLKKAMANGVKLVACTMSMDVMGIKKEELLDGVELGGVAAYLGDAEESNVNLFI
ncbi:MAG TPA: DsrE/DsrF/DrsH-like family protein [Feifaniaceae bacterium]|nr:DsrE/DsrF/DrsH-like family protein [Feifaniaceae bacterium]